MSKIKDGGPAFPVIAENGLGHVADGMALRDWFAAQALSGWLATYAVDSDHPSGDIAPTHWADHIARASYRLADAMIRARGE